MPRSDRGDDAVRVQGVQEHRARPIFIYFSRFEPIRVEFFVQQTPHVQTANITTRVLVCTDSIESDLTTS